MVTQLNDNQAMCKDDEVKGAACETIDALTKQHDDVFASELPKGVLHRYAFETTLLEPNSGPPFKCFKDM